MITLTTNNNLFSALIIAIILIAILFVIFIAYTLRMRNNEKGIYENETKNICPFDSNFCAMLGKSLNKKHITEICLNCPKYDNFIKKGLDEIKLREKIKKITK